MFRYSILTYNFNDYEIIHEIKHPQTDVEYVYVTDNPNLKSDTWKIVIDESLSNLSVFDKCYYVRFHPWKYVTTDICARIDGSMSVEGSFDELIAKMNFYHKDVVTILHPHRNTMSDEYNVWVEHRNYDSTQMNKCLSYMKDNGFDVDNYKGLIEQCFVIQRKTEMNEKIDTFTYDLLKKLGKSDTEIERLDKTITSFIIQTQINEEDFLNKSIFLSEYNIQDNAVIKWCLHHTDTPIRQIVNFDNIGFFYNKEIRLTNLYVPDFVTLNNNNISKPLVIVSMTSWKGRINSVVPSLWSLFNQTLIPNRIILNLTTEEFPNKEQDLPYSLLNFHKYLNGFLEFNWVEKNTRTFKKIIPTIQKYMGLNYYLLSVDDDCLYRVDYVSRMLNKIISTNVDAYCNYNYPNCVIGSRMIYHSTIFKPLLWEKLNNNIIKYGIDDEYYTHYINSFKYKLLSEPLGNDYPNIIYEYNTQFNALHDEYIKDNRIEKSYKEIHKVNFLEP